MDRSFFDLVIDRKGTNCLKYDDCVHRFGTADVLPLWVADMDFRVAPAISRVAEEIVKHGIYGYHHRTLRYYEAVMHWMFSRHKLEINPNEIFFTPGVVPAISYLIQAFSNVGDGILIQTPVYYPFFSVITDNKRNLLINQLVEKDNYYYIDFEDFERKASQAKIFLLCSPHNPVSRVWDIEELQQMAEICDKYGVLIISDEIHSDIVFGQKKHVPLSSLSEKVKNNVITCHSPSKTFNLAGLGLGYVIISNSEWRKKFKEYYKVLYAEGLNVFAYETMFAAYYESDDWYFSMLDYVYENYMFIKEFVSVELPFVRHTPLEATYLVWLDFRQLGLDDVGLRRAVIEKAQLGINDGPTFGPGGSGFQRINIACPRSVLEEALVRLKRLCPKH
ncbi:MAG: PatB family C-S lyase [Bacteroidales bacterium]|nr:PatB family C-S lyase [Bacteroidales bacterium]